MKKFLIILIVVLAGVLGWYLMNTSAPSDDTTPAVVTEEESESIARAWVENEAPTYVYDGINLELVETLYPEIAGCDSCYQFVYSFESRAAGYGDRSDQMLAQVITPHETVVTVEDGEVTNAVTDGVFDEMSGQMLEENVPSSDNESSAFSQTGNLVMNNPGMEPDVWYLVYDQEGAPGINVALNLTDETQCVSSDGSDVACDDSFLTVGARMSVDGERDSSDVVRVDTLTSVGE